MHQTNQDFENLADHTMESIYTSGLKEIQERGRRERCCPLYYLPAINHNLGSNRREYLMMGIKYAKVKVNKHQV